MERRSLSCRMPRPTRRCLTEWRPSRGFSAGWPMCRPVARSPRARRSIGCAGSMAYRVDIARSAEADLEDLYLWVVERAPQQGTTWFNGLERAVLSLDQHPERCPVAAES